MKNLLLCVVKWNGERERMSIPFYDLFRLNFIKIYASIFVLKTPLRGTQKAIKFDKSIKFARDNKFIINQFKSSSFQLTVDIAM